jgi:hypothetical protein
MGFAAVQVLSGATLLSELGIDISKDWQGYKINNLGTPTTGTDAANMSAVLTELLLYLAKAGGTMSGAIAMGNQKITGLGAPVDATDAARLQDTVGGAIYTVSKSNETSNRDLEVPYQNDSGKIRICIVTVQVGVFITSTEVGACGVQIWSDSDATPTTQIANAEIRTSNIINPGLTATLRQEHTLTFIVPVDHYYMATEYESGTASIGATIISWFEYDLF